MSTFILLPLQLSELIRSLYRFIKPTFLEAMESRHAPIGSWREFYDPSDHVKEALAYAEDSMGKDGYPNYDRALVRLQEASPRQSRGVQKKQHTKALSTLVRWCNESRRMSKRRRQLLAILNPIAVLRPTYPVARRRYLEDLQRQQSPLLSRGVRSALAYLNILPELDGSHEPHFEAALHRFEERWDNPLSSSRGLERRVRKTLQRWHRQTGAAQTRSKPRILQGGVHV